jgi:hypothetical protein
VDDLESLKKLEALALAHPRLAGVLAVVAVLGLMAGAISGFFDPKKPRAPRPEAAVNLLAIFGNAARGAWPWLVQLWTGRREGEPSGSDRPTDPPGSEPPTPRTPLDASPALPPEPDAPRAG